MIFRFQISGFSRLLVFHSLCRYSTTTTAPRQPPRSHFLVDYLVHAIGSSKDEALSATKKVILYKSSRNPPALVVNFFKELGLNRNQIRSIALANPRILTCNVERTLRPKALALQELGIRGSDLIGVLMGHKSILAKGLVRPAIEYLRDLLGSDETVAKLIKRYSIVLDISVTRVMELNVQLLKNHGLSKEWVTRFLLTSPRCFMQKPERLQEILYMVETELGIPRHSKMFYYGVLAASSVSKKTLHAKVRVLRSFGLSDLTIYSMFKKSPCLLGTSEDKLRRTWNFFTKEIGYTPDYLGCYPIIFKLSLERRVIPRYNVVKVLNEKNLWKKKCGLYRVLCISDSTFIDEHLLPYKNEIPDVADSYFKIVGRKKTKDID